MNNWMDDWNEKAMDNHIKMMKNELGDKYKEYNINIGWGVDEISLTISSKIYSNPIIIFRTLFDKEGNIIIQELEKY
jgi:hypothetical protein